MTEIGFLLFPRLTQLDLTGPWEVLSRGPDARCRLMWTDTEPVTADSGLTITPTATLADTDRLDVLVVPGGGAGVRALLKNEAVLGHVRRLGQGARYVTSVCTGSLILGAAGLLDGYRATTHWSSVAELEPYGAIPTAGRVVRDRNRFTGGGVTAGIDFGLTLAAELWGDLAAQAIQLGLEYAPAPPFDAGTPETAPPEVLDFVRGVLSAKRS